MSWFKIFPDAIRWNLLLFVSLSMFCSIIILAFVKPFIATILSYILICFWSRVPCHMSDYTKDMELIDFFSLLVAINLGAIYGGFFAWGVMWMSWIFGKIEYPIHTWNSANGLLGGAVATPFLYEFFNHNLLLTMYGFTVVRYITFTISVAVFTPQILLPELMTYPPCLVFAYISNTAMVVLFGDYFSEKLVMKGIALDWKMLSFMGMVLGLIILRKFLFPKMFTEERKKELRKRLDTPATADDWTRYS